MSHSLLSSALGSYRDEVWQGSPRTAEEKRKGGLARQLLCSCVTSAAAVTGQHGQSVSLSYGCAASPSTCISSWLKQPPRDLCILQVARLAVTRLARAERMQSQYEHGPYPGDACALMLC